MPPLTIIIFTQNSLPLPAPKVVPNPIPFWPHFLLFIPHPPTPHVSYLSSSSLQLLITASLFLVRHSSSPEVNSPWLAHTFPLQYFLPIPLLCPRYPHQPPMPSPIPPPTIHSRRQMATVSPVRGVKNMTV